MHSERFTMKKRDKTCWLQLSDLHIFYSSEWDIMLKSYEELAEVFKPNFIIVTGDFCHIKKHSSYDAALEFLNKLSAIFNLSKKDFFFVPGNHDVRRFHRRYEIITTINSKVETDPEVYKKYSLLRAFKSYDNFVRTFYGNSLENDDPRYKNPSDVYLRVWKDKVNIVALNTALISNGEEERHEIIDLQELSQVVSQIDKSKPTIVIAHHSPNSLANSHRTQLERFLSIMNARVYLCGDEHKLGRSITNKFDAGNQTLGIICGKSAAEPQDDYSDVCVIGYTWEGNNVNVEVFKWYREHADTSYQFIKSDKWYHHIDKPFSFKMTEADIPTPSITDRIEEVWDDFLTVFEEEDRIINQRLGQRQIKNKSGNSEQFKSEKIMRSLIMIGIPFPAVSEITRKTIDEVLDLIASNEFSGELDTKKIRLKVLEAIRSLEGTKWPMDKVGNWCTKYIRRYGHNNRIIQICNIPEELNNSKSINDANYKFIKEVFIPDLFQSICPSLDIGFIPSSQKTSIAEEIIAFINGCDLYIIDYNILKRMIQEIATKPPHPWIINSQQRQDIIEYDRSAVKSNLSEIAKHENNNTDIPHAVFVELLHHTSAMILDRYFNFLGCEDLDSFTLLSQYFKKMIDTRFDFVNWDLMLDNREIKSLVDDFALHGISISDYYEKLCAINPKSAKMSNEKYYITLIKDFANESLRILDSFESRGENVYRELERFVKDDWNNYNKDEVDHNVEKILSLIFPTNYPLEGSKSKSVWWVNYLSCYSAQIDNMKEHVFVVIQDANFEKDMLRCLQGNQYKEICNAIFFIKENCSDWEHDYEDVLRIIQELELNDYTPVLLDKSTLFDILCYPGKKNVCFDEIVLRQKEILRESMSDRANDTTIS